MRRRFRKGVALWDLHYPEHDDACVSIVKQFLGDFSPDFLLYCGDQLNFDCISFSL